MFAFNYSERTHLGAEREISTCVSRAKLWLTVYRAHTSSTMLWGVRTTILTRPSTRASGWHNSWKSWKYSESYTLFRKYTFPKIVHTSRKKWLLGKDDFFKKGSILHIFPPSYPYPTPILPLSYSYFEDAVDKGFGQAHFVEKLTFPKILHTFLKNTNFKQSYTFFRKENISKNHTHFFET